MKEPRCRARRPAPRVPQMTIAFPTKGPLDAKERSEVVALLSRLLLQVATARDESEVDDDPS